MSQKK